MKRSPFFKIAMEVWLVGWLVFFGGREGQYLDIQHSRTCSLSLLLKTFVI